MFGQSLLSAFGSAACTTDDSNYPIANIAYYKMSDASDSATHTEFATWDPNLVPTPALYNGNLRMYGSGGSVANGIGYSNQSVSSGKHYWEHTVTAIGGESSFGIARPSDTGGSHYVVGTTSTSWGLYVNGNIYHNSVNLGAYMSGGFSNGDIIGAELDLDNGTLKFYKNGTGYGNAFTGLTGTFLVAAEWRSSGGNNDHIANFGASSWAYNPSTGFVGVSELASYNGTASNVNFNTEGKFGFAGAFNGSNSYVSINSSTALQLLGDYAVSFWFKTNAVSGTQRLVNKDNANDFSGGWGFSLYSNSTFNWSHNDGSNNQNWNINAGTISTNTWYNVCAVYSDSNNLRTFYLNGSSVGTIATNTNVAASTDNLFFGTYGASSPSGQYLNGSLDQIRIYDSAISAENVTSLYNEIQCPAVAVTNAFNTVLYNGNGGTQAVTGVGFKPDFVWIKARNGGYYHILQDSVRGAGSGKSIYSNGTEAEGTYVGDGYTDSFQSNGFTVAGGSSTALQTNGSGINYVSWNWKAGGAAVQNNDGTIQGANCLVSANQDAGFSITKYTGNGISGATFGHGLGQQVGLSIVKNVGSSTYWYVYSNLLPTNNNLYLNTSDSKQADGVMLGGNSTTVSISASSAVNTNNGSYIAYNFTSIAGYSKIGSYTGTGATGNVQYVGFEPAFVMVKATSTSEPWFILDNKRDPNNPRDNRLMPDSTAAESNGSVHTMNFNSNNFTLNGTVGNGTNGSGQTYIFLAIK